MGTVVQQVLNNCAPQSLASLRKLGISRTEVACHLGVTNSFMYQPFIFGVLFPRVLSYADNSDADDQTSVFSDSSIQRMNPAGDELFWYSCLKAGFGRYDNLTKAGPSRPVKYKAWPVPSGLLYAELGLGYRIICIGGYCYVKSQFLSQQDLLLQDPAPRDSGLLRS